MSVHSWSSSLLVMVLAAVFIVSAIPPTEHQPTGAGDEDGPVQPTIVEPEAATILDGGPEAVGEGTRTVLPPVVLVGGMGGISTGTYESVLITDGTKCSIKGATVTVEGDFICNKSSTLTITNSKITVKNGTFYFLGDSFKMEESLLSVNAVNNMSSDDGGRSEVFIKVTGASELVIENSGITCLGGDGVDAGGSETGGKGGNAALTIASGSRNIAILGKYEDREIGVRVEGGQGGMSGEEAGNRGGAGGKANLLISSADELELEATSIEAQGGDGGEEAGYGTGGEGGNSWDVLVKTEADLTVYATSFASHAGVRGGIGDAANAQFQFDVGENMYVDDTTSTWSTQGPLSYFNSTNTQVVVEDDAEFYQVGYESRPYSAQDTEIWMYYWLKVWVMDGSKALIDGTELYITDNVGSNVDPMDSHIGFGWHAVCLLSRIVELDSAPLEKYSLTAKIYGEEQTINGVKVDDKNGLGEIAEVTIFLDLIKLEITDIKVQGKSMGVNPIPEYVGGETTFLGTATKPERGAPITKVTVAIILAGSELHPYPIMCEDLADPEADIKEPKWSTFRYVWDTTATGVLDGKDYILSFKATDGTFESYVNISVRVGQSSINHPPVIEQVMEPGNLDTIKDTEEDRVTTIKGLVYDQDHSSSDLIVGLLPEEVYFEIANVETGKLVLVERNQKNLTLEPYGDPTKPNRYEFRYDWNTRATDTEENYRFDEGLYVISIVAFDGDLDSSPYTVHVNIRHLNPPTARLSAPRAIDKEELANDASKPIKEEKVGGKTDDAYMKYTVYIQNEDEDNIGDITLVVDARDSFDLDGANRLAGSSETVNDLRYCWDLGDGSRCTGGNSSYSNDPEFKNTYNIKVEKLREDKKRVYTLFLRVEDADGLTDDTKIEIELVYQPYDWPKSPLAQFLVDAGSVQEDRLLNMGIVGPILWVVVLALFGSAIGFMFYKKSSEEAKAEKRIKTLEDGEKKRKERLKKKVDADALAAEMANQQQMQAAAAVTPGAGDLYGGAYAAAPQMAPPMPQQQLAAPELPMLPPAPEAAMQPPGAPAMQPPGAPAMQPPGAPAMQPPGAPAMQPPGAPAMQPPGAPAMQPPGAPAMQPPGAPAMQPPAMAPPAGAPAMAPPGGAPPMQPPGAPAMQPPAGAPAMQPPGAPAPPPGGAPPAPPPAAPPGPPPAAPPPAQ